VPKSEQSADVKHELAEEKDTVTPILMSFPGSSMVSVTCGFPSTYMVYDMAVESTYEPSPASRWD
jgi:hypothetical protein